MAKSGHEETIIAHGVRVEGDFVSQGGVLIEGEVSGTIQTAGDLRVGGEAKIRADVTAANAIVAGEIRGNVQIADRLELLDSAKMIGDLTASVLSVSPGAQINGNVTMDGRDVKVPDAKDTEEEEDEE